MKTIRKEYSFSNINFDSRIILLLNKQQQQQQQHNLSLNNITFWEAYRKFFFTCPSLENLIHKYPKH